MSAAAGCTGACGARVVHGLVFLALGLLARGSVAPTCLLACAARNAESNNLLADPRELILRFLCLFHLFARKPLLLNGQRRKLLVNRLELRANALLQRLQSILDGAQLWPSSPEALRGPPGSTASPKGEV